MRSMRACSLFEVGKVAMRGRSKTMGVNAKLHATPGVEQASKYQGLLVRGSCEKDGGEVGTSES